MTFNYNDIIEYIDCTYDANFNAAQNWCYQNRATFDELIGERKEVEVEYKEIEHTSDGDIEVTKKRVELHRFFKINEIPVPIVPEPTLDELKYMKREEINQARNAAEQGGFEYMGKIFDSDPISCQRISCAAQAMSMVTMSEEVPTITWTCQDNTTIDLNPQELMGLVVALAQWSNACHQKATALKEKIESCTSKEELDKIVWG